MKQIILTILVLILGLSQGFSQGTKEITIKTKIYCDHCRKCESCGGRLEEVLFNQKGVRKVFIDDKAMTIFIAYNPAKLTPDQLRDVISRNGYDADSKKATAESYARLDDCCKKQ